jgi:hypothetical protein
MIVERVTFFGVQIKLLTYDLLKAVRRNNQRALRRIIFRSLKLI